MTSEQKHERVQEAFRVLHKATREHGHGSPEWREAWDAFWTTQDELFPESAWTRAPGIREQSLRHEKEGTMDIRTSDLIKSRNQRKQLGLPPLKE